jgi:hypothetical protein
MATHTVTSASATETATAAAGRRAMNRAAEGGPIIKLNTKSAPTTGSARVVAAPTERRNQVSTFSGLTPRAAASSGATEVSISRRYMTTMRARQATAIAPVGRSSPVPAASGSPNKSENVCAEYSKLMLKNREPRPSRPTKMSAVTTSWRARRPHLAIAVAARKEKAPTPASVFTPTKAAPAAPVKAPWGMA